MKAECQWCQRDCRGVRYEWEGVVVWRVRGMCYRCRRLWVRQARPERVRVQLRLPFEVACPTVEVLS